MKLLARVIALSCLLVSFASFGQTAAPTPPKKGPTTRILAIGRLTGPPTAAGMKLLASHEVPDTLRLFLAGKIDQWYSIQDGNGVVFILNVTSVEEAQAMLDKLPLGQAKLMTFQLIPLGPLSPLGLLLPRADEAAK